MEFKKIELKTEQYKGYPIKFVEKILGEKKLVAGQFKSQVTGKILGDQGTSKEVVLAKVKKMIDLDKKYKSFKE